MYASLIHSFRQVPIVLRREQLSAPFRGGDGAETDDDVEGKGDEVEEGEYKSEDGDHDGAKPKSAKGKGKGKARAKAKATAAKAKAKAKAKASGKSAAKAKAAKAKVDEKVEKGETCKDTKPLKRKSEGDAEGGDQKRKGKKSGDEVATFARRYKPEHEPSATRFQAIRDIYQNHIANQLVRQSSYQDSLQLPKLWRILGNMVDKECFQIEFQFQEQKIPETLGHGRCDFRTNGSRCAPGPSNHPMHPPMWSTVPWRPRRSRSSWLWRPFASCF